MLDNTDRGPDLGERLATASGGQPVAESTPQCAKISFEELYRDWQPHVARWVRTLGVRPADHDDLIQEIFVVASRGLRRFDGRYPGGWLFNIAWRKVRDHRNLSWNRRLFRQSYEAGCEELLLDPWHPQNELEVGETAKLIDRALASMSVQQRDTFLLFAIEGHTGHEIARTQNVPINTVWARLHRTRAELERQMLRFDVKPSRWNR